MSRLVRFCLLFSAALVFFSIPKDHAEAQNKLTVLCYHDVILTPAEYVLSDTVPILVQDLANHFDWLKANGYTVVSFSDVVDADKGKKPLPEKAVLLTFDDGYSSFYTTVFPMLKAYGYPAVLALNTGWLETPSGKPVQYSSTIQLPREYFITWEQARTVARSGLVELASHSHGLHKEIRGNREGNLVPHVDNRIYYPDKGRYQTEGEFKAVIQSDFKRSADIIAQRTGFRPRLAVWPYGRYTDLGLKAVRAAGYEYSAVLRYDFTTLRGPGKTLIERCMLDSYDKNLAEIFRGLEDKKNRSIQRVVHVDLDYVYDPNPAQVEKNLSLLLDRIEALGINTVYLQAYADPDGNGTADALYFPNRHLPVRADLFNRVATQLNTRVGVQVYAWMPLLGFEINNPDLYIRATKPGKEGSSYSRLSPFNERARTIIKEIYSDLASAGPFHGILYHDDGIIGDYEDASEAGQKWLKRQGFSADLEQHHKMPGMPADIARKKGQALIALTHELTAEVKKWRPFIKTARNIYPLAIINPESEAWLAQNYQDFLNNYDYTAVLAMPYMEKARNPQAWLDTLADAVTSFQDKLAVAKTVFELQSVHWRKGDNKRISSEELARQMKRLQEKGIRNIGYYPENFIAGHPDTRTILPVFSLKANEFLGK